MLFCFVWFFFLRIPFLSFGIDFVGQGCILTLLFHHEYIPKSYWNMWCHFRSWRGGRGMIFWDFSCFSLMLFFAVHLPCSAVQHKVHLVHWYFNLLKGDYVTKIKDLEKPSRVFVPDRAFCPPQLYALFHSQNQNFSEGFFLPILVHFPQRLGWAHRQPLLLLAADCVRLQVR